MICNSKNTDILKNKDYSLAAFKGNVSIHKKCRVYKLSDTNKALHDWYTMVVSKNIYPKVRLISCHS